MSANNSRSFVYANLPRAGLGNMLFVWARALVFAHLNDLPLRTSSWTQPKLGPFLRGERHTRLYWGYFDTRNVLKPWQSLRLRRLVHVEEPPLEQLTRVADRTAYVFSQIPHWADYFVGLKSFRHLIRERLWVMTSEKTQRQLADLSSPCIAVHVRMGDFRRLQVDEDFASVGLVRTPLDYFIDLIEGVRSVAGKELPVTVFSDGKEEELAPLLAISGTRRSTRNPDIVDLLLMAQSQLIICSAGSTFGYWAGFLADAPVLLHPDHIHAPLRPTNVNQQYFEGGVRGPAADWPALFKQNVQAICMEPASKR